MVNLSRLQSFKVLVVGDFLLDTYTTGKVRRISPEAPVPIMEVIRHEARPGGAGNVALNMQALGGQVTCLGRIGDDVYGEQLKKLLPGMNLSSLVVEKGYPTPVKNRLIADSQQLMRIDSETISWLLSELEEQLLSQLKTLIPNMQVVALSDYGKGFLTNRIIQTAIEIARAAKVPVIVDPKGADFTKYKGASILKPNLSEAFAAAKKPGSTPLEEVAQQIFSQTAIDRLLITRSEAGMSLFSPNGVREDFPVVSKEVKDVTGAGDTVLAVLCLALANHLDLPTSVHLSNIAAGIAIERLGCVQVTLPEIAERLLKNNNHTKVFDISQTYALEQVLKGKTYSLFILSKEQPITVKFFKQMHAISAVHEIIAYVRDGEIDDEFVQFLSTLNEIGTIILQKETLKTVCETIHPEEIFSWEKDHFVHVDQAKNVLKDLLTITLLA